MGNYLRGLECQQWPRALTALCVVIALAAVGRREVENEVKDTMLKLQVSCFKLTVYRRFSHLIGRNTVHL
jgi:hypothetical protein